MPVEIRELIIRTHISDGSPSGKAEQATRQFDERAFIEKCVEKVLRKLNKSKER